MFNRNNYINATQTDVDALEKQAADLMDALKDDPKNSGLQIKQDQALARASAAKDALIEKDRPEPKYRSSGSGGRRCGF